MSNAPPPPPETAVTRRNPPRPQMRKPSATHDHEAATRVQVDAHASHQFILLLLPPRIPLRSHRACPSSHPPESNPLTSAAAARSEPRLTSSTASREPLSPLRIEPRHWLGRGMVGRDE